MSWSSRSTEDSGSPPGISHTGGRALGTFFWVRFPWSLTSGLWAGFVPNLKKRCGVPAGAFIG
jgi:hypothetical protein